MPLSEYDASQYVRAYVPSMPSATRRSTLSIEYGNGPEE